MLEMQVCQSESCKELTRKGGYKSLRCLEDVSWDMASGLPMKLSLHETKQGAIQNSSISVLPPVMI